VLAFVGCSEGDGGGGSKADGETSDQGDATAPPPTEGTWTDPATGLMWQVPGAQDPLAGVDWSQALAACEALRWAGFEDWVLPTLDDLRSLIRGCAETATGGACPNTNACPDESAVCYDGDDCMGCLDGDGPGVGGCFWVPEMGAHCNHFWSATRPTSAPGYPCYAHLRNGHVSHNPVEVSIGTYALCVRAAGGGP
jgi:hypothetical protein